MGRHCAAAIALALALNAAGPSAQSGPPSIGAALTRARVYVTHWQDTLASLVAEEDYSQELSHGLRPQRAPVRRQRRKLRSELLLLQAPAEKVWLSYRDVMLVDGKAVGDRQTRFDSLFAGPAAAMVATAERIAEEGARFNLGRVRTINTPTAALVFLHPRYELNTAWDLDANERLGGRRAWKLDFDQRKPPFAVNVPTLAEHVSTGSFWLEPDTGAILKWDLRVRAGMWSFRVTTTYGNVPAITEGRVPIRMEEQYDAPPYEQFVGVARYSRHRLFRTSGRIIGS